MLFSSVTFLFGFLPAVLALYFLVPRRFRAMRNAVLLVFSLAFYGWGEPSLILLMLASVAVNYLTALICTLPRLEGRPMLRRSVFILGIALNIGMLGVFKYAAFAVESLNLLGLALPVPQTALPLGISFYTFQGMGYLIDVYRGDAAAERNPAVVALYISLFPQLIAGPIVRYSDVSDAIFERTETFAGVSDGLARFAVGFSKKMLLANTLAEAADSVFDITDAASLTAIIGALAYTGQIYFDFSGYSDMAIGLGKIFGFDFRENFNKPYRAVSASDFWRRWHISLSGWFRDYVYIPLGGSRCTTAKTIRNLAVVWLLTGLWHGASWNFVVWGLWWLVFLLGEKYLWGGLLGKLPKAARHVYLMLAVVFGWILFRADTLTAAVSYAADVFGRNGFTDGQTVYLLLQYKWEFAASVLAVIPTAELARKLIGEREVLREILSKCFITAAFALSVMSLVAGGYNPFIYFRF